MPYYRRVGQIPPKRHTQFRQPDGTLYAEELMGVEGFSSDSSLLYHRYAPTAIVDARAIDPPTPTGRTPNHPLKPRHLRTHALPAATGADAVRRSPDKPGISNLLEILAACGGSAEGITTYGALKRAVTDAVVAELDPLQKRYAELAADPTYVDGVFRAGAERCREVTAPVLAAAQAAIGL